jgi:predicted DNA-binding transcriptional regulator AlpA
MSANLLSIDQAAAMLQVSRGHLANMRVRGTGPAYVKLGSRTVRYDLRDLENWLLARKQQSTSHTGSIETGAA